MGEPMGHHGGGQSGRRFPVLALHGFPGSPDDWQALQTQTSDPGGWLIPDMPWMVAARGRVPDGPLDLRKVVEQILAFSTAQTSAPFHIIGHDLGGAIAWWIAAMLAQRVVSLAVIAAPHPKVYASARAELDAAGQRAYLDELLADADAAPLRTEALLRRLHSEPAALTHVKRGLAKTDPAALRSLYRTTMTAQSLQGAALFPALSLPVLYLQGEDDRYFPPDLCEATGCAAGPNAYAHLLEGAGHFPQITHAEVIGASLGPFWMQAEALKAQ